MTASAPPRPPDFGELAPLFVAPTDGIAAYNFGLAGGRWIVLMVFGSLGKESSLEAYKTAMSRRELFDDRNAAFFGVSVDRADPAVRGLRNDTPGVRFFWDFDLQVSRLYGLVNGQSLLPAIFLIDPMLRIVAAEPLEATEAVMARLAAELKASAELAPEAKPFAPILLVPRVFEPEFCAELIAYFQREGGEPSGFATEVDGQTVTRMNPQLKRRTDVMIQDEALLGAVRRRLTERLLPVIERVWGWRATEIERDLICCYSAEDEGFFSAHRDDATAGTAHRRFAVSLNLNSEDYEGGELHFPEFGRRTYKPATGAAAVFGCTLLHAAGPVTRGLRYTLVPFLYDEAGARLRDANLGRVGDAAPAPVLALGGRGR
jgi:predicted 2-oxoglutarate/Fe(II)-dependent dioxygenase YbiX/peroxiredoxin